MKEKRVQEDFGVNLEGRLDSPLGAASTHSGLPRQKLALSMIDSGDRENTAKVLTRIRFLTKFSGFPLTLTLAS